MPRVPLPRLEDLKKRGVPNYRQQVQATPESAGAGDAAEMKRLAAAAGQLGDVVGKAAVTEFRRQDEENFRSAYVGYRKQVDDIVLTAQELEGEAALNSHITARRALDDLRQKTAEGMSGRSKARFLAYGELYAGQKVQSVYDRVAYREKIRAKQRNIVNAKNGYLDTLMQEAAEISKLEGAQALQGPEKLQEILDKIAGKYREGFETVEEKEAFNAQIVGPTRAAIRRTIEQGIVKSRAEEKLVIESGIQISFSQAKAALLAGNEAQVQKHLDEMQDGYRRLYKVAEYATAKRMEAGERLSALEEQEASKKWTEGARAKRDKKALEREAEIAQKKADDKEMQVFRDVVAQLIQLPNNGYRQARQVLESNKDKLSRHTGFVNGLLLDIKPGADGELVTQTVKAYKIDLPPGTPESEQSIAKAKTSILRTSGGDESLVAAVELKMRSEYSKDESIRKTVALRQLEEVATKIFQAEEQGQVLDYETVHAAVYGSGMEYRFGVPFMEQYRNVLLRKNADHLNQIAKTKGQVSKEHYDAATAHLKAQKAGVSPSLMADVLDPKNKRYEGLSRARRITLAVAADDVTKTRNAERLLALSRVDQKAFIAETQNTLLSGRHLLHNSDFLTISDLREGMTDEKRQIETKVLLKAGTLSDSQFKALNKLEPLVRGELDPDGIEKHWRWETHMGQARNRVMGEVKRLIAEDPGLLTDQVKLDNKMAAIVAIETWDRKKPSAEEERLLRINMEQHGGVPRSAVEVFDGYQLNLEEHEAQMEEILGFYGLPITGPVVQGKPAKIVELVVNQHGVPVKVKTRVLGSGGELEIFEHRYSPMPVRYRSL